MSIQKAATALAEAKDSMRAYENEEDRDIREIFLRDAVEALIQSVEILVEEFKVG